MRRFKNKYYYMIKTEWDLEKHFYQGLTDPNIELDINDTLTNIENFIGKYHGKIRDFTTDDFFNYLNEPDLSKGLVKVNYYYNYLSTLNTQDQEVLKHSSELSNTWSDISRRLLFVNE